MLNLYAVHRDRSRALSVYVCTTRDGNDVPVSLLDRFFFCMLIDFRLFPAILLHTFPQAASVILVIGAVVTKIRSVNTVYHDNLGGNSRMDSRESESGS